METKKKHVGTRPIYSGFTGKKIGIAYIYEATDDEVQLMASKGMLRHKASDNYKLTADQLLMLPNEVITVEMCAYALGVTPQAVTDRIRRGSLPNGVKFVDNRGRTYDVYVCTEQMPRNPLEYIKSE